MSYHKDLEEYTEQQLNDELERRRSLRDEGKCDYCCRLGNTPSCKFADRHLIAIKWWDTVGRFQVPPEVEEKE